MVRTARSVGVCLLLLFHSVLLHAQVIPGRWEKVEAQKQGTVLTVIMKSGDRFDCTFEELQMDTLVVETGAGEQRIPFLGSIPTVAIQRLETLVSDPVKDGTVKGVVIGAVALGFFGGFVGAFPCSGSSFCSTDTDERIQYALVFGTVGAGIGAVFGAAIGFTVDKVADNKRPEVLYIAR